MYRLPGVRSGTWLTENEETYRSSKGFGNYGLVPVGSKYTDESWEKSKEEIAQDFQRLRKSAVTASKKVKEAVKTAYDWTRMWGPATLASAGALTYACLEYPGDQYGWIKDPLLMALLGSSAKLGTRLEKKLKSYLRERKERKNETERESLRREYFGFRKKMKEVMEKMGGLHEEMNAKYIIGVQEFTRLLNEEVEPERIRNELEGIRTRFKNYLETNKRKVGNLPMVA